MTYFSAFSGVGGFELALGDHACVGYSEVHRAALAVYRSHFPDHPPYGDITQLDARTLPSFDLLVAGFPCQAYSVAGRRGGFADARGAAFFDLARLIAAKRPRLLLLENVRGLLSHANGQTFTYVLAALEYDCQWEVRDAREHAAQRRLRLFLIGHRRDTRRPKVFPLAARSCGVPPIAVTRSHGAWRARTDATAVDASYAKGIDNHGQRTAVYLPPRNNQHPSAIVQRPRGKNGGGSHGVAPTITRGAGDGNLALARGGRLRRLTPRECERLMTWPDDWTRYGHTPTGERYELSDRARYTLCGNGVVTAVARPILDILTHS